MTTAFYSERDPAYSKRDYDLAGTDTERAVAAGLADAQWWRPQIDAARLRELGERSNVRAAVDIGLWVVLIIGLGITAWVTWFAWYTVPLLFLYGTLYGGAADSRWHECGHGTAFKSDWLNNLIYYPASLMLLREATVWKWSHVRHHSDTIVVGRDAEIVFPRPPQLGTWLSNFLNLSALPGVIARLFRHAAGNISDGDKSYIPANLHKRVVTEARIYLTFLAAIIVWCLATWSIKPAFFFGLPTIYGAWLVLFFGTTQHAGLREDVLDHRLNTRTVYMNPIFRWLYLNMNYHVEHHVFPTVPYRALPALHAEIKDQLYPAHPSTLSAYREIIPTLRRQVADPTYELDRGPLPGTAAETPPRVPREASAAFQIPSSSRELASASNGLWVTVCTLHDLAPGEIVGATVAGAEYAVYNVDGELYATDGICTHSRVARLADGVIVGGHIECPKHNGRFEISSGEPCREPVTVALNTYDVRVDGTAVQIRTTNKMETTVDS